MPLLPVAALGGGRSVAPLGHKRMDGRLPPAACEQREQECHGDQTGRNVDKAAPGSCGTGSSSLGSSLASTATPSRGRRFLASPTAGATPTPSPKSPKHHGASGKVRFRSVESVREFTPSNAPSSMPHSPDVDLDTQGGGADIPIDRSSPFFGGSGLRLALAGEQMLWSSQ